jgi:hypothetical protein
MQNLNYAPYRSDEQVIRYRYEQEMHYRYIQMCKEHQKRQQKLRDYRQFHYENPCRYQKDKS